MLEIRPSGFLLLIVVAHAVHLLRQNPDAGLLDIGANIGMYTLTAAKMGRKV